MMYVPRRGKLELAGRRRVQTELGVFLLTLMCRTFLRLNE
jgi:hypothetical protein